MRPFGLTVITLLCQAAGAQISDPAISFEVASIKPSGPRQIPTIVGKVGGPGTTDPGRVRYLRLTLRNLINRAYAIPDERLAGADAYRDALYDIQATVPSGTSKLQERLMLQSLLAERFKLIVHHEQRQMDGYTLVQAKGGAKLTPAQEPESVEPPEEADFSKVVYHPKPVGADGFPLPPADGKAGTVTVNGKVRLVMKHKPLPEFAAILGAHLRSIVVDETHLPLRTDGVTEQNSGNGRMVWVTFL